MPSSNLPTYTLAQVKEHNTKKSNWIVIHDHIYDVTPFLDEHPGGEEVLVEQGGKDATEAFEDVGHSGDARTLMKEYQIGQLAEEDRKFTKKVPEKKLDWSVEQQQQKQQQNRYPIWLLGIGIVVPIVVYQFFFNML